MEFSSSLLESAVGEFAKLPGIGKKQHCGWFCIY